MYAGCLLQSVVCAWCLQVLALQAAEPLLLVSSQLASQHSSTLAALLTDPHVPSALSLQAVATAGTLITTRPAESSQLVQHLELLLLKALATADSSSSTSVCSSGGSGVAGQQPRAHDIGMEQQQQWSAAAAAAAAVPAAKWYCRLLLSEKLLLTGCSWGIVAQGLLADGPMKVCSGIAGCVGVGGGGGDGTAGSLLRGC
jgi:hypothetical protein